MTGFGDGQAILTVANSTLSHHGGDITDDETAVDVSFSFVEEASYAPDGTRGGTGHVNGHVNADPQFVDAADPTGGRRRQGRRMRKGNRTSRRERLGSAAWAVLQPGSPPGRPLRFDGKISP